MVISTGHGPFNETVTDGVGRHVDTNHSVKDIQNSKERDAEDRVDLFDFADPRCRLVAVDSVTSEICAIREGRAPLNSEFFSCNRQ
jgi:hypothetical protein